MRELIDFGYKLKKRFNTHDIGARSAQMTYYWILAFFPFMIMIVTILSYTSFGEVDFMEYVRTLAPASMIPFLENTLAQLIQYRSATLLSFGALVSIWSASAAVNVMIKGIHKAYNAIDSRPFWIRKLLSMFYTVVLAVLIAVMILLLVFGNKIGEHVLSLFISNHVIYRPIWDLFRYTTPIIGLLLGFYLVYRVIPRKHLKNKNIWPGTLVAGFGWYGFSMMFSVYIEYFSKYNQMYGSLGGVFILLIWLYMSGMVLLLGAEINALYQDMQVVKHGRYRRR
ncbi:MAG: YihY/virulence factor BrkB family protein [Cellulosilyticaceae bacterium]